MQQLPIDRHRDSIEHAMRSSTRIILQGPTGSGKSTRVPPWVADQVGGKVLVLQPRRLAARLLARRVADEQGEALGERVGYQVRFENRTKSSTQLIYCTEGILLRMLVDDPELSDVSAVVFDEFHERHIFTDVSLARLLKLQAGARKDLLLVVMSATLDLQGLADRLAPCETIAAEGRSYPVDVEYLPASALTRKGRDVPVWDLAASALRQALAHGVEGDVLVFMPGGYEIRRTIEAIRGQCRGNGLDVRALYGDLSAEDQDRALSGGAARRVIVSTNIAETSITIDGVRLVIDSGLARQSGFDPGHGINRLDMVSISQASAEQRRGRAGRTAPGVCLRLWSEAQHRRRPEHDVPEIHRVELSEVALGLKASGETDLHAFPWFDPPSQAAVDQADQLLRELGATDDRGELNAMGKRLLRFPVHPRFGRMMVEASQRHCLREVALVSALLQGRALIAHRAKGGANEQMARAEELVLEHADPSDVEVLLRAYSFAHRNRFDATTCQRLGIHGGAAREAGRLQKHFLSVAKRMGFEVNEVPASSEEVVRCLLTGLHHHTPKSWMNRETQESLTH